MKVEHFADENDLPPQCRSLYRQVWAMIIAGAFLVAASFTVSAGEQDAEYVSSADTPGPLLQDQSSNPSYQAYNRAVSLYLEGQYDSALMEMRSAVRARRFDYPTFGLAFSNLCMMYLKVGKFKNAQAACTKALAILPGYVPATLNLGRAKQHIAPEG